MATITDKLTLISAIMAGSDDAFYSGSNMPEDEWHCGFALKRQGDLFLHEALLAPHSHVTVFDSAQRLVEHLVGVKQHTMWQSFRDLYRCENPTSDQVRNYTTREVWDLKCRSCNRSLTYHVAHSRRYNHLNPSLVGTPEEKKFNEHFYRT